MITNLITFAASVLVTNSSESFPMTADMVPCPEHRSGCCVVHYGTAYPVPDPKQKRIRATVTREIKAPRSWGGLSGVLALKSDVLSDVEIEYALSVSTTNWVAEGVEHRETLSKWVASGTNTSGFFNHFVAGVGNFYPSGSLLGWTLMTNTAWTSKP